MRLSKGLLFLFCLIAIVHPVGAQQSQELTSPDGNLTFSFSLLKDGVLCYSISCKTKPIVTSSTLGLGGWEKDFAFSGVSVSTHDSVWKPVYGERSLVRDHYEEMTITLLKWNSETQKMQLQVRAYNEGIAFRYFFPEGPEGGMDVSIQKELTDFTMPEGTKAWFTNRAQAKYSLLLPLTVVFNKASRP